MIKRWQYLTAEEQNRIRNPKPPRKQKEKPVKKKLDIDAIKVTLPIEEKLFYGKDWMNNLAINRNKK